MNEANEAYSGFRSDGEQSDDVKGPAPIQVRCQDCGFVFFTTQEAISCPGCKHEIWTAFSEARFTRYERKKYEVVRCPDCGRHTKNVTEDSVQCELCGKLLDTTAHSIGVAPLERIALRIGLWIMLVGWFLIPICMLSGDSEIVFWVFTGTLWLSSLPFLIYFLKKARHT